MDTKINERFLNSLEDLAVGNLLTTRSFGWFKRQLEKANPGDTITVEKDGDPFVLDGLYMQSVVVKKNGKPARLSSDDFINYIIVTADGTILHL